jgi:uncharacterized protein YecT (DUF1311 family)
LLLLSAAAAESANAQDSPLSAHTQETQPTGPESGNSPLTSGTNEKAVFQDRIPSDQLEFLKQFAGAPSNRLIRDRDFRRLLARTVIPNCTFHYGHDLPLTDAIDEVIKGSPDPVQIRDGRYLTLSGLKGPYLAGRGFIWIDLRDGIGLGDFYFHPTNGEPTPTVNIFSRQVKARTLALTQLPAAFFQDLLQWSVDSRIPPVTPRYFITGSNRKIVLEHDEDYCATVGGIAVALPPGCEQMNADAADVDLNAAYYLEQTHHATNSTAWLITGTDMAEWMQLRENACKSSPDPLQCRIRMTRGRIRVITTPRPVQQPPHR